MLVQFVDVLVVLIFVLPCFLYCNCKLQFSIVIIVAVCSSRKRKLEIVERLNISSHPTCGVRVFLGKPQPHHSHRHLLHRHI